MEKRVVDASKTGFSLDLGEILAYKDLFFIMAGRDVKVRYAQTALGVVWVLLQPITNLLIFTFIFGKVVKVNTEGVPYPIYALCGLCMWIYFSTVATQSGQALIANSNLVRKVYFPRLIIPMTKVLSSMIDLGVNLVFLIVLILIYGINLGPHLIFAPLFIALNIFFAFSLGIWLSALTIRYRDFQAVALFMIQIGIYATPVYYPAKLVPEKYMWLYNLNPMKLVVEGFRFSITGIDPPLTSDFYSLIPIFIIFVTGVIYFKKVERIIADVV